MTRELLVLTLLTLFLLVRVYLTLWRVFSNLTGRTWRKVLRVDVPENEKKGLERIYKLTWLIIGTWAFLRLWNWSLSGVTASLFGFLAFRGGAGITKLLVYGLHDHRVIREYTREGRALGVIGRATEMALLVETIFVVAFALAYRTLSVTLGSSGMGANRFILYLWIGGLVFGAAFGWLVARNNRGILLGNEIAVVGLFTTRKVQKKAGKIPRGLNRGLLKR
ncbi:hypothetical protein A3L12_02490 [Thermococcus sp. P6]|uniref:hypothetical protein n=1 Tax=Thermococcus sp. P6 TaxID=122420 RepID=UPI000B59B267|nr:hypothetical protein [Thermococcus sp. P6]ASJ10239.1 hypothetical protein A3L12_02490 [Thermococcus sp. P6]